MTRGAKRPLYCLLNIADLNLRLGNRVMAKTTKRIYQICQYFQGYQICQYFQEYQICQYNQQKNPRTNFHPRFSTKFSCLVFFWLILVANWICNARRQNKKNQHRFWIQSLNNLVCINVTNLLICLCFHNCLGWGCPRQGHKA